MRKGVRDRIVSALGPEHIRTSVARSLRLLLLAAVLQGCRFVESADTSTSGGVAKAAAPEADADKVSDGLKKLFESADDTNSRPPLDFTDYRLLRSVYAGRDFEPVWTRSFEESSRLDALVSILQRVDEHGLEPAAYHLPLILRLRDAFMQSAPGSHDALPLLDVALSDAAVRLEADLRYGLFDPKTVHFGDYNLPRPQKRYKADALFAEDVAAHFRSAAPSDPRYADLQNALRRLRSMENDRIAPIPSPGGKIEPGQNSDILGHVERRIKYLDQLRITEIPPLPESSFSSRYDTRGYTRYDSVLADEVREFQRKHGLLDDGILGDRTIKAMNMPMRDRIRTLRLNLERVRWLPLPDNGAYVRVNVPEFYLYAVRDGVREVRTKVCTGMRYRVSVKGHRPMNYQTPIVSGEISSLILNPPWNVPSSIATRETYYQALKDSTYLRRHRYRVIRRDSVIHSTSIKWRDHDPDNLPFRFVQDPGEGNALGRIKFMFANPFDIYLHDTPKRKPFTYASRTVSHGCIRVEEPMRLMAFLLKGHSSWSTQSVQDYLDRSRSTKTVILENKVPVYVDYVTAWVDERHVIQFRDDVYGKDGQLARAFALHSGGAW